MNYTLYFSVLLIVCLKAGAQISYTIPTDEVSVSQCNGIAKFSGTNFHTEPGQPEIPVQMRIFLLPPDADPSTLQITLYTAKELMLPGEYLVKPAPMFQMENKIIIPQNRTIVDGKDLAIYGGDRYFPSSFLGKSSAELLRDYKLVRVLYYPFLYNPVTKRLKAIVKGTVTISYNTIANYPQKVSYQIPFRTHNLLKQITVNYNEMIGSYDGYPVGSQVGSKYVVITTSAIQSGSGKLQAFIDSKKKRGFAVELVTESQWGGGSGDSGADKIRKWLVDNYQSQSIEYVLLIGNPAPASGDVPMKMTYPYRDVPTDFYYSDLSGNWDKNGNGKFGETGDLGAGGADAAAEVGVGRIPVYNNDYTTLNKILTKIITYENAKSSEIGWRKKMLLPLKGYNTPSEGSAVGEAIKKTVSAANTGWTFYRIYDDGAGNPELNGVSENFILFAMSSNKFGLVEWMTHGSATEALSTMSVAGTAQWDDTHPSFVFCGSCLNATPTVSNNLTYSLLKNGSVGAVGGTQTTLFSTGSSLETGGFNSGFIYRFGISMAVDKLHIADALNKTKAAATPSGTEWQNFCAFNQYGCPAIGIETNGDNTGSKYPDISIAKDLSHSTTVLSSNNTLTISYFFSATAKVKMELYSARGQLIKILLNETQSSGSHVSVYNCGDLQAGFYLMKFTGSDFSTVTKVLINR